MPLSCQHGYQAGWHRTIARFTPRLNRGELVTAAGVPQEHLFKVVE